MKIIELFEGVEPKLPGAPSGIKIMTPQQFIAASGASQQEQDVEEATALPAPQREFGGQEFQDYMGRIVGTPDIDKQTGEVKLDKKSGAEKYVSGKVTSDRYKMPYMHRSSVITYIGPDGKTYSEEKVIQALKQRPEVLLKQNEKMKHSNGELQQFFNIGFAALVGVAVDETTDKLIIVNTCPGAGACKVVCFAMKGDKVQWKSPWLKDGRILTYLLNDPTGFVNQLNTEINKETALGEKGGYEVTVRWHDAGDFFSPEYLQLALNVAKQHPKVKFYAYTKMAGAALASKPDNFIINWSEGAHTSQEKQVKANDPNLERTKNSRIVPTEIFYDLLMKDSKGNLRKSPTTYLTDPETGDPILNKKGKPMVDDKGGAWQVIPSELNNLKQRLADEYGISTNSILSYKEYEEKVVSKEWRKWLQDNGVDLDQMRTTMKKKDFVLGLKDLKNKFEIAKDRGEVKKVTPMQYNVIVTPGEGDISANDHAVLSTLLLKH